MISELSYLPAQLSLMFWMSQNFSEFTFVMCEATACAIWTVSIFLKIAAHLWFNPVNNLERIITNLQLESAVMFARKGLLSGLLRTWAGYLLFVIRDRRPRFVFVPRFALKINTTGGYINHFGCIWKTQTHSSTINFFSCAWYFWGVLRSQFCFIQGVYKQRKKWSIESICLLNRQKLYLFNASRHRIRSLQKQQTEYHRRPMFVMYAWLVFNHANRLLVNCTYISTNAFTL